MATKKIDKCQTHAHPEPTGDEKAQMYTALDAALRATDAAWGLANKTPSYHHITDSIGQAMARLHEAARSA